MQLRKLLIREILKNIGNTTDHHFKNDKSTNRPSLSPSSLLHPKHAQYIRAWDVQNMYEGGRYAYIERKIKNYNTFEKGKEDGQEIGR